ncbi:MAG: CHAD domain-containing protein [Alphaproteobacteria bacterium]|nr:CHAD domain-containing protein [Alphaproteobacteria bacterium]
MAFQFELDEHPQKGTRRIAREQVNRILSRLSSDQGDAATIHESRKSLKRLKALFKLVRGGLDKKSYRREYDTVRDVARSLSGTRDLDVLPVSLAELRVVDEKINEATAGKVLSAIEKTKKSQAGEYDRAAIVAAALRELEAAKERYADLKLNGDDFTILANGAAKGLSELREQHQLALSTGHDEDYHDWRKSAQLHWRHLRLLSPAWPQMIAARLVATKALADVLGHDHDLSVLARFVEAMPISQLRTAERRTLLQAACDRQQGLRIEARAYAGLLVHDRPDEFAARLGAYREARIAAEKLAAPLFRIFVPQDDTERD